MKRAVCLLCAACLILVGCGSAAENPNAGPDDPPEQEHIHNVQSYTVAATCDEGEKLISYCPDCGERWEETTSPPLGHLYSETSESPSALRKCLRPECLSGVMPESDRIYDAQITYTFDQEKRAEIDGYYREIEAAIREAGAYESGCAQPDSFGSLAENYNAFYQAIGYLSTQYQYANLRYYEDIGSERARADFTEISEYYTQCTSDFYVMFCDIYGSAHRDYFFYGWPQATVEAYLRWGGIYGSEEYVALRNANTGILLERQQIADDSDPSIPGLYGEYVSNYNRLAEIMGYESYPEYAYPNVYYRDFSYRDVGTAEGYVKTYLAPLYSDVYAAYAAFVRSEIWTQSEIDEYKSILTGSFFDNQIANSAVNGYFGTVVKEDAAKKISFAEALQLLAKNGNYFLSDYERAFTSYVASLQTPFIMFGPDGYRTAFTVVHEFGHYFDFLYNGSRSASYELKETHSQGNETLFLAYLRGALSERAYRGILLYQLQYALSLIVSAMAVNRFEIAAFTNEYTGAGSDKLLADGKIAPDEYDELYRCILLDFGIDSDSDYWRRTVFQDPCYYVAYAFSRVCSLQLLIEADKSYADAVNKYLKLFTYSDDDSPSDYRSVLEYAGLYDYNNEALYREIAGYVANHAFG